MGGLPVWLAVPVVRGRQRPHHDAASAHVTFPSTSACICAASGCGHACPGTAPDSPGTHSPGTHYPLSPPSILPACWGRQRCVTRTQRRTSSGDAHVHQGLSGAANRHAGDGGHQRQPCSQGGVQGGRVSGHGGAAVPGQLSITCPASAARQHGAWEELGNAARELPVECICPDRSAPMRGCGTQTMVHDGMRCHSF